MASPPLAQLPPASFFRLFASLNHLEQVAHFLFLPGMLFDDTGQWWGIKKMRPQPHEGIDIYLLQHCDQRISSVSPQMVIPAFLPGYLVHFHRDFLGETLYIRHPEIRQGNAVLHTLYGHTTAISGSGDTSGSICRPAFVSKGQIVGMISPAPAASHVPAHLHVSCAWIDEGQQVTELSWEKMTAHAISGVQGLKPSLDVTAGGEVVFIDPLPLLLR